MNKIIEHACEEARLYQSNGIVSAIFIMILENKLNVGML